MLCRPLQSARLSARLSAPRLQVGLDNAGKTTALYKLSLGQTVATAPTIGSNVERVELGSLAFELWDLGGQASQRSSWTLYFSGVDAIIVVVDSADRARIPIAKQELWQILAMPELERVPLLLLANKQVCRYAIPTRKVVPRGMPWHLCVCVLGCAAYIWPRRSGRDIRREELVPCAAAHLEACRT